MLKHFVELDHWGGKVTIEEVSTIRPEDLKISLNEIVRFRFFDKQVTTINGEVSSGAIKNFSCWYYVGKRLTISNVKTYYPNATQLIERMRNLNCDAVLLRNETLFLLSDRTDKVFSVQ